MRRTCAMNYHTNRPWNCPVVKAKPPISLSPPHSDWPEALKLMGGWLSVVWNHFPTRHSYQSLVMCVCGCIRPSIANLSRWKHLISTLCQLLYHLLGPLYLDIAFRVEKGSNKKATQGLSPNLFWEIAAKAIAATIRQKQYWQKLRKQISVRRWLFPRELYL